MPRGWCRPFIFRAVALFRSGPAERALAREIASHLLLFEDDCRRRGMSADEARRAARLALGGVERAKELQRDARSFRWVDDARRDVRHALRMLRRDPVATATVVVSLAVAIGAGAAVLSAARALLFSPPPGIVDAGRLVDIGVGRGDGGVNPASFPAYVDVRDRTHSFTGMFARQMFPIAIGLRRGGSQEAERVFAQFVTPDYFGVLGVTPAAGSLFGGTADDPAVVLSHKCWTSRFNGDAAAIGRPVFVNGQPFSVGGIAPPGFHGTSLTVPDLWLPLETLPLVTGQGQAIFSSRDGGWLMIGGRLKPGVSVAAAAADVDALARDLAREHPRSAATSRLRVLPSSLVPGNRAPVALFLVLMTGMAMLLLLVACANVSGILLARGSARRREIAMRLALGAGRGRLVRQLLTETAVLFLLAGATGVLIARAGTAVLASRLPPLPFPITLPFSFDSPVVACTIGLSLLAALAAGLAPALQSSKMGLVGGLKDAHGPGRSRLRQLFIVVQVASSVALVVTAGLSARAIARAGAVDPGFDPRGVELASIDISMAGYTDASGPAFWRSLAERVRALPGVEQATVARVVPGGFEGIGLGLGVPGARSIPDGFEADGNIVEPGYFQTLGIRLLEGRDFTAADRAGAGGVAIVGQTAARHFWPGESAIGKYVSRRIPGGERRYAVVGVAADIRSTSLVDGMSQSFVYLPLQQAYASDLTSSMTLVTRTRDAASVAPAVGRVVASLAPGLPGPAYRTLDDSIALGLVPQHVALAVSGGLGSLGVLLAAIGIYGISAFMVACRVREFAIRRALGAQRADIVFIVMGQALLLTLAGCAAGAVLAAAAAGVLAAFLLGIPALDPAAFGGAVALFTAVGALACSGPLRRAIGADPIAALRCD